MNSANAIAAAHSELIPCLLPDNQRRLGRYRLLYRFASGGMASLYLARLEGTDGFAKTVAVKVMHRHLARDAEFVRMFIDEARLASRITHPNVVQIYELGRAGESHFIVMEYVEGESALELLRRATWWGSGRYEVAARVVAEAAAGLHAAHELCDSEGRPLQVVHRDVSPDNILLSYDGAVKVTDFGVARARDSLHCTVVGTLKGKFSYMAPEQAEGMPIDRRADVFSLGVVLYELTVGRRLFRRESDSQTLKAVERCRVPAPTRSLPGYPRALETILMTALARDPERRFDSARALQQALEGFLRRAKSDVSCGAVGRLLSTLFADRIARKREDRRRLEGQDNGVVPDLDALSNSSAGLPAISVVLEPSGPALRLGLRTAVIAAALIAAACISGLVCWLVLTRVGAPPATASATASARASAQASLQPAMIPLPVPVRVAMDRVAPRVAPTPTAPTPAAPQITPQTVPPPPPPKRCALRLTSAPPVQVYLGRRLLGRTPLRTSVPRGRLRLLLRNRRLGLTARRTLTARRPRQRAHLALSKGTIRFSLKRGHHVQLDGRTLGRAPLKPVLAYEGTHRVVVVNPVGYRKQRFRVTVRPRRTVWVSQAW